VRPPLHEGDVAPARSTVVLGHYSRWQASPTTFGPEIKIGVSVFLVGMVALGLFFVFFILWFVQLFVTGWLLKELWRPGWISAESVEHPSSPPESIVEPLTEGFRVPLPPERYDALPPGPRTAGETLGLALLCLATIALVAVSAWGTAEMRVGAIMLGTLLGMYAFFRSFLR
jgi:hypothetical protein